MYNKNSIFNLYNYISDDKLEEKEINELFPKIEMFINKIEFDDVEIIELIDILKEIKIKGQFEKICPEIIDLIIKIKSDNINELIDFTHYGLLKYILLPFEKNKCDNECDVLFFLSEFEIIIEVVSNYLNNKELDVIDKYNHELKQIIINYKDMEKIYYKYVKNEIFLNQMMSHFISVLYFNLDEFDYDYDLLIEALEKIINKYYEFIDYCQSQGIKEKYNILNTDIDIEYKISYNILKYLYDDKHKDKVKKI